MIESPIQFFGSKRKEVKIIDEFIPKNVKTFYDLYGGGGSVSLYFYQKYKWNTTFNDIFKPIFKLFKTLQNEEEMKKFLEDFKEEKARIEKLPESEIIKYISNPNKKVIEYFVARCFSYRGMPNAKVLNKKKVNGVNVNDFRTIIQDKILKYPPIIKNINVLNEDAIIMLEKLKNEDVFIYLDPPYIKNNSAYGYYDNISFSDIKKICDIMNDKNVKAKIMLNIDFNGHVFLLLKDKFKHVYNHNYGLSRNNNKFYKTFHAIYCNY